MKLIALPALRDNYVWILVNDQNHCLIVDPGESQPVQQALDAQGWQPQAVLLTHHHADHTQGVTKLRARYPDLPVYGPAETLAKGANQQVRHGQPLTALGREFAVIATPGHTAGHVCYFSDPWLFCGDTLFSAGCGRLFEGSAAQMYQSLQTLNQLPAHTLVCCGHEYTLDNLRFALSILPEDRTLTRYYQKIATMRQNHQPTLPSTLAIEREINLFLRADSDELAAKINESQPLNNAKQRFAWLRAQKDHF